MLADKLPSFVGTIGPSADEQQAKFPSLWRESLAFYAAHSAAVFRVLLPPAVIAYAGALGFQYQIEIVRAARPANGVSWLMSHGGWAYERIWMPLQALTILKQWFLWVCYSFALVGICNLVNDEAENESQSRASVFSPIREHPLRFLGSTTLFFGILVLAFTAMTFIMMGVDTFERASHIQLPMPWEIWVPVFLATALVAAVIARWAFAIPLTMLQDMSFAAAMRRSDQLSDYRTLAIWALILESEIAGYLALIAPAYIRFYMHIPPTAVTYYAEQAAALPLSAITQAPLMIAVGLVLANGDANRSRREATC